MKREPEALLGAVQQAIKKEPAWGARILAEATKGGSPDRLIDAILWGFRDAAPTAETQLAVLQVLSQWEWPNQATHALGSLLDHWARDLKPGASAELLDAFDRVADQIFARSGARESGLLGEQGWTERAINHPAGNAASVWWRIANLRDSVDGKFVLTLDDAERGRWERALNDDSAAGAHARVILGMASDRLSAGDYPWSERALFPAFDPTSSQERAAQLWDGRLMQTRWSWTTIRGLRPVLQAFLENSSILVPARSRQLGGWIAMLVANPQDSAFTLGDLQTFVRHARPEARRQFAEELPDQLDKLEPESRKAVWDVLLRPYWRDRRTNVPVALDPEEVSRMMQWVPSLPEAASDALAELIQTEGANLPHAEHIIWKWENDDQFVRAQPRITVSIIKWLAERRSIEPWTADKATKQVEKALEFGAPVAEVISAGEALAALPSQTAVKLVERLRQAN